MGGLKHPLPSKVISDSVNLLVEGVTIQGYSQQDEEAACEALLWAEGSQRTCITGEQGEQLRYDRLYCKGPSFAFRAPGSAVQLPATDVLWTLHELPKTARLGATQRWSIQTNDGRKLVAVEGDRGRWGLKFESAGQCEEGSADGKGWSIREEEPGLYVFQNECGWSLFGGMKAPSLAKINPQEVSAGFLWRLSQPPLLEQRTRQNRVHVLHRELMIGVHNGEVWLDGARAVALQHSSTTSAPKASWLDAAAAVFTARGSYGKAPPSGSEDYLIAGRVVAAAAMQDGCSEEKSCAVGGQAAGKWALEHGMERSMALRESLEVTKLLGGGATAQALAVAGTITQAGGAPEEAYVEALAVARGAGAADEEAEQAALLAEKAAQGCYTFDGQLSLLAPLDARCRLVMELWLTFAGVGGEERTARVLLGSPVTVAHTAVGEWACMLQVMCCV